MSKKSDNTISFFIITFILTLPGYILCGLASQNIIFPEEMIVLFIFLSAIAPFGAAIILFHAVFNVSIAAFPNYQVNPQYGVMVTTSLVFLFVVVLLKYKQIEVINE